MTKGRPQPQPAVKVEGCDLTLRRLLRTEQNQQLGKGRDTCGVQGTQKGVVGKPSRSHSPKSTDPTALIEIAGLGVGRETRCVTRAVTHLNHASVIVVELPHTQSEQCLSGNKKEGSKAPPALSRKGIAMGASNHRRDMGWVASVTSCGPNQPFPFGRGVRSGELYYPVP